MTLIDEVKSRTDIVQVIAETVDLDTSSRSPKSRCPFHAERTPSFFVFPETGSWRCFGACATGGDVFAFVMKRDNLSFKEALHFLADRAGVRYEPREAAKPSGSSSSTGVRDVNGMASAWFKQMLLGSAGEAARRYLEARGISTEIADRRGIGFAPGDGMLTLSSHLRSSRAEAGAVRDARLVVQGPDRNWRDFFRNRVTIAIHDRSGKIIGFGARSLDGSEPKYLNTPQTDLFDKSRVLYGLHWASDAIRQSRRAVVVEGYMDAITAHEHGFNNVVASMGTAVTPEQLRVLSQLVSGGESAGEVVLCLDSDAAGQEATLRALETAWREFGATVSGGSHGRAAQVKVAAPASGKDPDEAIRADAWAWRASLDEATPLIDFIISAYTSRYDTTTGDGKARVVEAAGPLLFAIGNDYDRDAYWTKLAETLQVSPERLRSMVASNGDRGASRRARQRMTGRRLQPVEKISIDQLGAVLSSGMEQGLEEHVLSVVLQREELREYVEAVPPEHFLDTANREIFTAWRDLNTLEGLAELLGTEIAEKLDRLVSVQLPPSDHIRRVEGITQCVRRMRERYLRHLVLLTERTLQEQELTLEGEERERLRQQVLDPGNRLKQVFTGRM